MKALVKRHPEPGLWLEEVPVPEPGIDDVLVRIDRTGICGTDLSIFNWDSWAQRTIPVPMVVGHESDEINFIFRESDFMYIAMESTVTVTEAARNFSDLINRVVYRGECALLTRNGKSVARIVPERSLRITGREAAKIWANRQRMNESGAEAFANDLAAFNTEEFARIPGLRLAPVEDFRLEES